MPDLSSSEINSSQENLSLVEKSSIINTLQTRDKTNKPLDVLCLDIDGTVYMKEKNSEGKWVKKGDNSEVSNQLRQKNIPQIMISARPDHGPNEEQEMLNLKLNPFDVVIVGAGTVIYWRNQEGNLELDKEFVERMANHPIGYRQKTVDGTGLERGIIRKAKYNPQLIKDILEPGLDQFKPAGFQSIYLDSNVGVGFTTLHVENMTFEDLKKTINYVKNSIQGIRVTFSEDIEHLSKEQFNGWIQIIPACAGKDKALRYVLEKIAHKINPFGEENKKIAAHIAGDSAIDIWMLAMGTNYEDPYSVNQYRLGNSSPYAKGKLDQVKETLNSEKNTSEYKTGRQANLKLIDEEGPSGIKKIVDELS